MRTWLIVASGAAVALVGCSTDPTPPATAPPVPVASVCAPTPSVTAKPVAATAPHPSGKKKRNVQHIAPAPAPATSETPTYAADTGQEEVQLATIDAGGYVASDDAKVSDFRNMLNALSRKYDGSRHGFANVLVVCQQKLNEKGIKKSLLDIGWALDESCPTGSEKQLKFEQVAALYVVLESGNR